MNNGTPTFLWGLFTGILKYYSEVLGKTTALRLSISESFNYNVVFKNCTWNENSCCLSHSALGRKNHDEFGRVFVDTTELYLKKKLHCTDLLHY